MPRKITVATASLRYGNAPRTVEDNLVAAERLVARTAAISPDIVCLPEVFPVISVPYRRAASVAEPVPGPITERFAALARRFATYLICPVLELSDGRVFNTAVLLDRRGEIVGRYRKLHPTLNEVERGVVAGDRVQVFETDFGRVGILICFDILWADSWAAAKALGAEVIVWTSAYPGGLPLQARACDYECYVVSCTPSATSQVLDITGYPLASTGQHSEIAWAEIDLEKRLFSTDDHKAKIEAMVAKYGRRVGIKVFSDEEVFTLQSEDPAVSVSDLIAEFGLEPQQEYVKRSAVAQDASRGSTPGTGAV